MINISLPICILFLLTSCDAQDKAVENDGYVYSEDSIFKLGNKEYSLKSKAIYDTDGNIQKLEVYKSEGKLSYNRFKLLKDKKLLEYYGFPFHQKMIYSNGVY